MQVSILPLKYIRGVADMKCNSIVVSSLQTASEMVETILHEVAHLIVGDFGHTANWELMYRRLGGQEEVRHDNSVMQYLGNVGYMPNIGNISGIQNIY